MERGNLIGADSAVEEACETARANGDLRRLAEALGLGIRIADELVLPGIAVARMRECAALLRGAGQQEKSAALLVRATGLALRACRDDAADVASETAAVLEGVAAERLPTPLVREAATHMAAAGVPSAGRELLVRACRDRFARGEVAESVALLAEAAHVARLAGQASLGIEMWREVLRLAESHGIHVPDAWIDERAGCQHDADESG